jgi:hypothetical protein
VSKDEDRENIASQKYENRKNQVNIEKGVHIVKSNQEPW